MLELSTFEVDTAMDEGAAVDSLFEGSTGEDEDAGKVLDSLLEVVMITVELARADEEATEEDTALLDIGGIAELDIADAEGDEEAAEELGLTVEALLDARAADEDQPP